MTMCSVVQSGLEQTHVLCKRCGIKTSLAGIQSGGRQSNAHTNRDISFRHNEDINNIPRTPEMML